MNLENYLIFPVTFKFYKTLLAKYQYAIKYDIIGHFTVNVFKRQIKKKYELER